MKKTKSFNDTSTPPVITGRASLPGGGNLFARPVNEELPDFEIDSSDPFLSPSPTKVTRTRTFRRTKTLDSMPLNAHTLFGTSRTSGSILDKENLDPGLNSGRRLIDISATSVA